MKTLINIYLALLVVLVSACGPTGNTEKLKEAVEKNKLGISSITIKPAYTRTLDPVSNSPARPKYYFAHSDTEQLQAFGITDSGDEIALTDVKWAITDNSGTAGATTIDPSGVLKTETLAASQTKEITVTISFASLTARADIVVSSHPLMNNGLSLKINNVPVNNNDTQVVVVCDTTSLTAQGVFEDGSTRDITSKINWPASITDNNAKFNVADLNYAVFSSHTINSYTVTPDYKGQDSATVYLDVKDTGFSNFTISPASAFLLTGANYQLSTRADINSGSGTINKDVSDLAKWSSADNTIFTVDSSGLVLGIAKGGPLAATAQCGSFTATSSITVSTNNAIRKISILDKDSNPLDLLTLTYINNIGETANLTLMATMNDNTEIDITTDEETIWSVRLIPGHGDPITINNKENKGLVTAVAVGIAEVIAKHKGEQDDLTVDVKPN